MEPAIKPGLNRLQLKGTSIKWIQDVTHIKQYVVTMIYNAKTEYL